MADQDYIPLPQADRPEHYVTTARVAKLDGRPIPGEILAGPFDTAEEAQTHCAAGQRVWLFDPL